MKLSTLSAALAIFAGAAMPVSAQDTTPPTAAVVIPADGAYLNSIALIGGTAADDVAVSSAQAAVIALSDGRYWDGSAWTAAETWLDADLWPSSWTYTAVPAWVSGSSYTVIARAMDSSGNWSVAYATSSFVYDVTGPAVAITAPVTGSYASFTDIQGTAYDAYGVTQTQVSVLRESDGLYWDGAGWAAGPLWNTAAGTSAWSYTGITQAALTDGATYLFDARAYDPAGNVSGASVAPSTFAYQPPPAGSLTAGSFSGVGSSSLTVNWGSTFAPGTVYYVNLSSFPAASPYLFAGSTDTADLVFTGLTPDTSYYGFVSTDAVSFTPGGSGVTLAEAPSGADFTSIAYSSVTLSWLRGPNPADTVFEVYLSTASDFSAPAASGAVAGSSFAFQGLREWTPYYGRVRAVGRLGARTAYADAPFSALTLYHPAAGAVSGLAGAAPGVSSINWTWSAGNVEYSDLFAYYDGGSVFLGTAPFGATGSYAQTGLGPNTPHLLRVAGRNSYGQGPLADSATVYTLADTPSSPSLAAVGYSSAVFSWSGGSNPAGTVYEYEFAEVPDFSSFLSSGSGTGTAALFTSLAQGATYYGRVRAVNGDGLSTAYAEASPAVTAVLLPSGLASGLAGAALGTSSVTWTWNSGSIYAADAYALYDGAGVPLATAPFAASGVYTREGLGPNTPHMLLVAGLNDRGAGPLAASASYYTLAAAPGAPAAAVWLSSAAVSLDLNGNPAGTALQLWRSEDGVTFSNVYDGAGVSYADPALAECSAYYYKARARNGAGVYSGFGGTLSFVTPASTPSAPGGLYAEPLDGGRVALAWEPSPSLFTARYSVYYDAASGTVDYGTPLAVLPSTSTSWTTPALTPGSTYKFAVRAGGACGTEESNVTLLASAKAVASLEGVRAVIKVPSAGKRVKGNSVTVVAELVLGLPSAARDVRFQYSPAGAGAWADVPAAGDSHPNPDTDAPYFVHLDADSLAPGAYDLRAVATDIYGSADAAPPSVSIVVDPVDFDTSESVTAGEQSKEQRINNTVSSTVQAADETAPLLAKVVIPPGAVTDSTAALTLVTNPAALPAPPSGADALGLAMKVVLSNGQSQLAGGRTAALSFTYRDDDGDGVVDGTLAPVDRLRVYAASDSGGAWSELPTAADRNARTITAATPHFSFFSVFAAPAAGLGAVKAYPVPWQPGSGGRFDAAGVTFGGLPAAGRIRIYTITGELVRQLDVTSADAGQKVWDGRNSEGHKAASGVYLALVKSGSEERTLKVAVER